MRELYQVPADLDRGHLPFRQAASAFMGWQLRRGLLNSTTGPTPGSPWWRAMNERLVRDGWEARALSFGHPGTPESPAVAAALEFIRQPSARRWYRAHNISIVSAYLEHEDLASHESRVERFFINLVLMRVLYAHALVAAPRLALGRLALAGRPLGDPRLGMTGIFLSLSRVLPDRYPLGDDMAPYIKSEHGLAHALDVGVIQPRVQSLYDWSARELGHSRPATAAVRRDALLRMARGRPAAMASATHAGRAAGAPVAARERARVTRVEVRRGRRVGWVVCDFPNDSPGSTVTSPTPFSDCGPAGYRRTRSSSTSDAAPESRTAHR